MAVATGGWQGMSSVVKGWDSPWLNAKFLTGLLMLLAVVSIEFIGPLLWNTDLARVGSSPTNVVPLGVEANTELGFKPSDPAHPKATVEICWPY